MESKAKVTKEAPKKEAAKDGFINVKNISDKNLNLSAGGIKAGATGKATVAEFSYLSSFLEKA